MTDSRFVYVTYIKTTPEKLWQALTTPEFTKTYFFGAMFDTDWQPGSPWRMVKDDGAVPDTGVIVEATPPHRLEMTWRSEWKPEMFEEGFGRMVAEIEPAGDATKLTVIHTSPVPNSKMIASVSGGWPKILSNLKSLLETGAVAV